MPRRMKYREVYTCNRDLIILLKPSIWHHWTGVQHAEASSGIRQVVEQEFITPVRAFNLDAEFRSQCVSTTCMIDMAMGEKNLLDLHTYGGYRLSYSSDIPAGVDHRTKLAHFIKHDGAILLKWGYRNDLNFELCHENHWP